MPKIPLWVKISKSRKSRFLGVKFEGLYISKWAEKLHRASLGPIKAVGFSISSKLNLERPEWPPQNHDFWVLRYLLTKNISWRILAIFSILAPRPPQNCFFELVMVTNLFIDRYNSFLTPKNYFLWKVIFSIFLWSSSRTMKSRFTVWALGH